MDSVEEMVDVRVQRYWGIWHDVEGGGGFIRNSDGRFIYYPHPGIAQAHVDSMMRGVYAWTGLSVREFIYNADNLES